MHISSYYLIIKVNFTPEQDMKVQRVLHEVGGQCHGPTILPPGERASTHCTRGWVDPRASLNRYGKSQSHWDSIQGLFSL